MEATCQISLDAILHNYRFFQERMAPARIIPVVKANAYGHGAIRIARYLFEEVHPELFAVSTLEEAIQLGQALPDSDILIFSRVFPEELDQLPPRAIMSLGSLEDARALQGQRHTPLKVHLNVNTGMNRLGLSPGQTLKLIQQQNGVFDVIGLYSHFSSSDTADHKAFDRQSLAFDQLVRSARDLGFNGMIHLANSAAALKADPPRYDAMRLGIGLYGYDTSPDGSFQHLLIPAMEVKAPLIRVEPITAGEAVSYGEKWIASRDTTIGTLRIGYADGYNRLLTNRGMASHEGRSYPVIGTVTMDHIMIDLGEDRLPTGVQLTVMGGSQQEHSINTLARQLNTIPYEVCCAVAPRVKRIFG